MPKLKKMPEPQPFPGKEIFPYINLENVAGKCRGLIQEGMIK